MAAEKVGLKVGDLAAPMAASSESAKAAKKEGESETTKAARSDNEMVCELVGM